MPENGLTFVRLCRSIFSVQEKDMHLIVDKRGYVSESISYRVKGEKNPKSKRVNIGKMVDKEFVPNAYFREREANEELQEGEGRTSKDA